jgi:hypothetical protein
VTGCFCSASLLRTLMNYERRCDDAQVAASDRFGDRYVLEFAIEGPHGNGIVRSTWIVRRGERAPRVTSCFVKYRRQAMNTTPQLLDVVALLTDVPAHGLLRGQVGTVVELLDGAYEVEFSDDEGKTYAELALQSDQLLILHHRPLRAA